MLETIYSFLSFVVLLGILVFVHELGHFVVAKKSGIRCDRFSLGFPPNIFVKKWGETEYCLGIIPLGGYVKMAGETPGEEIAGKSDEFASKSALTRFLVILAGPFMNYALAVILYFGIVYFHGVPTIDDDRAVIGAVSEEMPAAQAGILPDDVIIAIDSVPVTGFDSLVSLVKPRVEEDVLVTWTNGVDTTSAVIRTKFATVPKQDGTIDTVGQIGVSQKVFYERTMGLGESMWYGVTYSTEICFRILSFVGDYVSGNVAANSVGGPLFIAKQSAQAAKSGIVSFLTFMAFLSINLAVLNVMPIPVLDGGHMLFILIEKIKGSPLSMKVRMGAQQVGMVFLFGFILFVSWNDVMRWIGN